MAKYTNQFTDSFKYLRSSANNISQLGVQINSVLNRLLPTRILSKANIFNLSIDVAKDLSMMMLLHVEDSLVEQNMLIAQKELSVRGLATIAGHRATRATSSTGIVNLAIKHDLKLRSSSILINDMSIICNDNGLVYQVTSDVLKFSSNSENIQLSLIEGVWLSSRFISTGSALEKFQLDDPNPIENNNIKVYVNNERWFEADSLYDMSASDKKYITKNGIGSQVDIIFGDGSRGLKLTDGDIVDVKYLISNGEDGNLSTKTSSWSIITGTYDINGASIDINDSVTISTFSNFLLGSNGETIDATRLIAGYSSRALVFNRPENLKAYLNRLSILSHIDVWSEPGNNVFNLLLLPNVSRKLSTPRDILSLDLTELTLTAEQKSAIIDNINGSNSQSTSTELLIVEPELMKYAIFVYIDAIVHNAQSMKVSIENAICKEILDETFASTDGDINGEISLTSILDSIWSINNIKHANVDIVSEQNELARINGKYSINETIHIGSTKKIISKNISITNNDNPQLGFDELGTISTIEKTQIPILRGGFKKWSPDGNHVLLEKSIYIFNKTINGFEEL